jgi:hypothetical protein
LDVAFEIRAVTGSQQPFDVAVKESLQQRLSFRLRGVGCRWLHFVLKKKSMSFSKE